MANPGSATSPGSSPNTGESLLIIDNDDGLLELLAFVFKGQGFTVLTARRGTEGIALARAHRPGVIISDIIMDDIHGFEVLRSLRADPELARSVVVMISAKSYKPDIDRAKEMGADDYVVKPFYPEELVSRVERLRADRAAPRLAATFWGTRGSIAAPGPATTLYGGNTACVEVRSGQDILIFDAGTGIRELGLALAQEFRGRAFDDPSVHQPHALGSHPGLPVLRPGLLARHDAPHLRLGRARPVAEDGPQRPDAVRLLPGRRSATWFRTIHVHEYRRRAVPDRRCHRLGDIPEPSRHGARLPRGARRKVRRVCDRPRAVPDDPRGRQPRGRSRQAGSAECSTTPSSGS